MQTVSLLVAAEDALRLLQRLGAGNANEAVVLAAVIQIERRNAAVHS